MSAAKRRRVDSPPSGVDPEVWAALPRELRAETAAAHGLHPPSAEPLATFSADSAASSSVEGIPLQWLEDQGLLTAPQPPAGVDLAVWGSLPLQLQHELARDAMLTRGVPKDTINTKDSDINSSTLPADLDKPPDTAAAATGAHGAVASMPFQGRLEPCRGYNRSGSCTREPDCPFAHHCATCTGAHSASQCPSSAVSVASAAAAMTVTSTHSTLSSGTISSIVCDDELVSDDDGGMVVTEPARVAASTRIQPPYAAWGTAAPLPTVDSTELSGMYKAAFTGGGCGDDGWTLSLPELASIEHEAPFTRTTPSPPSPSALPATTSVELPRKSVMSSAVAQSALSAEQMPKASDAASDGALFVDTEFAADVSSIDGVRKDVEDEPTLPPPKCLCNPPRCCRIRYVQRDGQNQVWLVQKPLAPCCAYALT